MKDILSNKCSVGGEKYELPEEEKKKRQALCSVKQGTV